MPVWSARLGVTGTAAAATRGADLLQSDGVAVQDAVVFPVAADLAAADAVPADVVLAAVGGTVDAAAQDAAAQDAVAQDVAARDAAALVGDQTAHGLPEPAGTVVTAGDADHAADGSAETADHVADGSAETADYAVGDPAGTADHAVGDPVETADHVAGDHAETADHVADDPAETVVLADADLPGALSAYSSDPVSGLPPEDHAGRTGTGQAGRQAQGRQQLHEALQDQPRRPRPPLPTRQRARRTSHLETPPPPAP